MMKRVLLWLSGMVVLGMLLAGGLAGYLWYYAHAPGPLAADHSVLIPARSGFRAVAEQVEQAGAVNQPALFWAVAGIYSRVHPLKAGEYLIPAGASPRQILDVIASGKVVARKITIAEGLTVAQIRPLLEAADGLSGTVPEDLAEGSLMPDTYHYTRDESREALVRRMQQSMREFLTEQWPLRASDLPVHTVTQVLTLASIVERETGVPSERPRVAAVFINRLRKGMKLQTDPTVIYAVSQGLGVMPRPLTYKDLETPHPYNTYVIDGLPPGPIANPSREAIKAVLNPITTDEYYFVADGTGGHRFAKTLDEHNRNVAYWRSLNK